MIGRRRDRAAVGQGLMLYAIGGRQGGKQERPVSFEITATRTFSAAHQLRLYDGSLEALHGHNWRVKVTVGSGKLDSIGVVMDFHELEHLLDRVINPLHNSHLNAAPELADLNPTAENLAFHVGRSLSVPASVILLSVEVWETEANSAVFRPGPRRDENPKS